MAMMSASPTAASAAAMAMENTTNITPRSASGFGPNRQKAMKFRFAALSISSMPTSTRIALRRVSAPARPMLKSSPLRIRYPCSDVIRPRNGEIEKWGKGENQRGSGEEFSFSPFLLFSSSVCGRLSLGRFLLLHRDDHGADHRRRQKQAENFERKDVFAHQPLAQRLDGDGRGNGRRRTEGWKR